MTESSKTEEQTSTEPTGGLLTGNVGKAVMFIALLGGGGSVGSLATGALSEDKSGQVYLLEEKIETLEKERDGLRLKLQLKHSEISDCLREKDQLREDLNRSVDGLEKYKEKYIDCKLVK